MNFKRATPQDSALLAEMNRNLIRDEGHRNAMNVTQLTRRMRGWLKGNYRAYLFELGTVLAGYCIFRKEKDFLYIRQFYIKPRFRRKGFGRKAFEWLCQRVWKNQPLLRLDVLVGNQAGIRFWRAVGFKDYCLTLERKKS